MKDNWLQRTPVVCSFFFLLYTFLIIYYYYILSNNGLLDVYVFACNQLTQLVILRNHKTCVNVNLFMPSFKFRDFDWLLL